MSTLKSFPAHKYNPEESTVTTKVKDKKNIQVFDSCCVCHSVEDRLYYDYYNPYVSYCESHSKQDMVMYNQTLDYSEKLLTRDGEEIIDIDHGEVISSIGGPVKFYSGVTVLNKNGNKVYFCSYDDPNFYDSVHGDGELA